MEEVYIGSRESIVIIGKMWNVEVVFIVNLNISCHSMYIIYYIDIFIWSSITRLVIFIFELYREKLFRNVIQKAFNFLLKN